MFHARSSISIIILTGLIFLATACTSSSSSVSPLPTAALAINITENETTYGEITQHKAFNQCNATGPLKAEVYFSESSAQDAQQELVLKAGATGEVGLSALAKLKVEGALEQHFGFRDGTSAEHQESVTLEVPPHKNQAYTLTWREARRTGSLQYQENGETHTIDYSYRIGLELISTTSNELTCTPPPAPIVIDTMDNLAGWNKPFCDEACGGANGRSFIDVSLTPGHSGQNIDNAVEISYTLKPYGWVEIEREIKPELLNGLAGLSFFYKNSSVPFSPNPPDTVEVKFMLRYPGDQAETAFGTLLHKATATDREWVFTEVLFSDFKCMFPENNCVKHPQFDLAQAVRLSFAISHKPEVGDVAGSGKVAFDDLQGIRR
jgi:hypothetical protein